MPAVASPSTIASSARCQPFSGPFLYYPDRRYAPAPLHAFIDFIKR